MGIGMPIEKRRLSTTSQASNFHVCMFPLSHCCFFCALLGNSNSIESAHPFSGHGSFRYFVGLVVVICLIMFSCCQAPSLFRFKLLPCVVVVYRTCHRVVQSHQCKRHQGINLSSKYYRSSARHDAAYSSPMICENHLSINRLRACGIVIALLVAVLLWTRSW